MDPAKIAKRSACRIQVGAVIRDKKGRLVEVGWNHAGSDGYGEHAEVHAIKRASKHQSSLNGMTIEVVAWRGMKRITSKPCDACWKWIVKSGISSAKFDYLGKTCSLSVMED